MIISCDGNRCDDDERERVDGGLDVKQLIFMIFSFWVFLRFSVMSFYWCCLIDWRTRERKLIEIWGILMKFSNRKREFWWLQSGVWGEEFDIWWRNFNKLRMNCDCAFLTVDLRFERSIQDGNYLNIHAITYNLLLIQHQKHNSTNVPFIYY